MAVYELYNVQDLCQYNIPVSLYSHLNLKVYNLPVHLLQGVKTENLLLWRSHGCDGSSFR